MAIYQGDGVMESLLRLRGRLTPQVIISSVDPIATRRTEDIEPRELFIRNRAVWDIRWDLNQLAGAQDQLFTANLEPK